MNIRFILGDSQVSPPSQNKEKKKENKKDKSSIFTKRVIAHFMESFFLSQKKNTHLNFTLYGSTIECEKNQMQK